MKLFLPICLSLLLSLSARAQSLPHMDLQMGGFEYEALLKQRLRSFGDENKTHIFADIFATGKRNLDWIRLLNQKRSVQISLSTPETQEAFPIDKPRIYNPEIIRASYLDLQQNMPGYLQKIIFGSELLPEDLPCSEQEYVKWGLAVDRVYQLAARWRTYETKMDYLLANSAKDIRAYHFLTTTPGLLDRLNDWEQIPIDEQQQIVLWLQQVCRNHIGDIEQCRSLTDSAIQTNKVIDFFNEHRKGAETIIHYKMTIPMGGKFSALTWLSEQTIEVPFVDSDDLSLRTFLQDNIQAEWQLLPFAVHVRFVAENEFGVKVIWRPGVTPHVPGLGSNIIYMDAYSPISEFDTQWTIRHEFGHVLGFPDCYIEFYDVNLKAIVGYQLDTSDLMCSRQGHFQDRHLQELKRVYQTHKKL